MWVYPVSGLSFLQDSSFLSTDTLQEFSPSGFRLQKPEKAGDNQHARIKSVLDEPVCVRVVDENNNPVEGYSVRFRILSQPEKSEGFQLTDDLSITDSTGKASTNVILGSKEGDYQVTARIEGSKDNDLLLFTFHARKPNWRPIVDIKIRMC